MSREAATGASARTYVPTISDAAVRARTGKDWKGWFGILDRAAATRLGHAQIAAMLVRRHHLRPWWSQMVTVEYERSRGLRARHQTAQGYAVAVSRTVATGLPHLYQVTARAGERRKWFPRGAFEPSSQTRDKYFRGRWRHGARLEIGFYARGTRKSQIAVQVSRLAKKSEVETVRATWKAALTRLEGLLED
jgi:hypothetical protein